MSLNNFAVAAFLSAALILPGCAGEQPIEKSETRYSSKVDLSTKNVPEGRYRLMFNNTPYHPPVDTDSLDACLNTIQTTTDHTRSSLYGTCMSLEKPNLAVRFYCYPKHSGLTYINGTRCGVEKFIENEALTVRNGDVKPVAP